MEKKTIYISIPCYNEVGNVRSITEKLIKLL